MTDKQSQDNKLIQDVTKHLDDLAQNNNDELNRALSMARQSALDKTESRESGLIRFLTPIFKPVPLSAFASIVLLFIVFMGFYFNQAQPLDHMNGLHELADIEVLMTEDNLEFYEDLEFYEWLITEETHSS